MSDSNSNINTSNINYKNKWDYIKKEYLIIYGSVFFILPIILLIFVALYNGYISDIPSNTPNKIAFLIWIILTIGYAIYIYLDADSVLEEQNENEKIQTEEEMEAESEALLKENDVCKLNPDICMHGGKCQSIPPDYQNYTCNCTAGWEGKNCNTPDDSLIKFSDIDPKCTNPETGEKHADLEWCNANFDGRGGHCVNKDRYDIECPVNLDGSPNYLYSEFGCDVLNDEVWCEETTAENIGKCVVRAPGEVGELCNVHTIGQDCLGNRNLIWDMNRQTCVPNCRDGKVYNAYEDKCVTYDCHKNKIEANCSSSTSYCIWDNSNKKCKIDRSRKQCQSIHKNKCNNRENCEYDYQMCYDKNATDCEYITSKEYCMKHPHCIFNNASGICKVCNDSEQNCIKNIDTTPEPPSSSVEQVANANNNTRANAPTNTNAPTNANAIETFKVGGRIKKNGFTVSSDGFVQGGYQQY